MSILDWIVRLLQGGAGGLASYLAAHVLLCLVPAFYIAGGMSALIPKETITRFLGRSAPKWVAYPAAALAGSLLAVCSCTIVPLFAGIYKKGAGIGPAITFLFFAPAANVLALAYTGTVIGADLAFARLGLSLTFGIGIGLIMALIFRKADALHDQAADAAFAARRSLPRLNGVFLLVLIALLLAGTLKIPLLTGTAAQTTLTLPAAPALQAAFDRLVPYDASKGEEGLAVQGAVLILLLAAIGLAAWKGMGSVLDGINRWTWTALALTGFTLLFAAVRIEAVPGGLAMALTGRTFAVAVLLAAAAVLLKRLDTWDLQQWLWESWRFVRQIFPLLVAGVFIVGMLRILIRPEWIEMLAGKNNLQGNLAGVLFGVFMYFPTLVEVPIAKMFLSLGMHRGPLLAYLMADPELSLQSILIISTIIGRVKAWTYVAWVALFSTLAGLIYGAAVDGASPWLIGLYLLAALGALAIALRFVTTRINAKQEKSWSQSKS